MRTVRIVTNSLRRLFVTIRHYSHCSYYSKTIRHHSPLFALFRTIRYSGFPDTRNDLCQDAERTRSSTSRQVNGFQYRQSPCLLKSCKQYVKRSMCNPRTRRLEHRRSPTQRRAAKNVHLMNGIRLEYGDNICKGIHKEPLTI